MSRRPLCLPQVTGVCGWGEPCFVPSCGTRARAFPKDPGDTVYCRTCLAGLEPSSASLSLPAGTRDLV